MTHDPLNESLAETHDNGEDETVMRINLDVPEGIRLILVINGVEYDLAD